MCASCSRKKSIYLLLRLAEKKSVTCFYGKKTSCKFSQDSCKPEKILFMAIIIAVRSIAISVYVCLSLTYKTYFKNCTLKHYQIFKKNLCMLDCCPWPWGLQVPRTLVVRRTVTVPDARDLAVSCAVGWNSLRAPSFITCLPNTYVIRAVTALRSTREQTADIKSVSQLYSLLMRIYWD